MRGLQQYCQNQQIQQENGRRTFFAINIISIFIYIKMLCSQDQKEEAKTFAFFNLAYHSLNILAAYILNLQLIEIERIISLFFVIVHSIVLLVFALMLIAAIFVKINDEIENNKFLAFIFMLCLTVIMYLILLIDIHNYQYLSQLIYSLENQGQIEPTNIQGQLDK
ncbi:hypothetical protein ABPG74_022509 [Tetrahymena malaccensis]